MDLVEIKGTVIGVNGGPNGNFFLVKTETGGFQKLYDWGWEYDFVVEGTKGTFLIDGLTRLNPYSGCLECIPRVIKFVEEH